MARTNNLRQWKYNIGDNIVDENRNITITNRFLVPYQYNKNGKTYIGNYMRYNYTCNICGFSDGEMSQSNLEKGTKCSCCSNRIIIKGINDLGTKRPDLVKYFIEGKEYLYSECSGQYEEFKCPYCGFKKKMLISNLVNNGFVCSKCSDGISYPEKFMISILEQLKIEFIPQLSSKDFSWCDKYKYDFYLKKYNSIIEINGEQHYSKSFSTNHSMTLEEQQARDILKKKLALNNNISNYITIDASKSDKDYIKQSILNNKQFTMLFDCRNIDWDKCNIDATKNILKEVCEYWDKYSIAQNLMAYELAPIFNVSSSAILTYLHTGNDLGWCNFSKEEQLKKAGKKRTGVNNHNYGKHLTIEQKNKLRQALEKVNSERAIQICKYNYETEKLIEIYDSINSLKRLFGYSTYSISECCKGNRESAYGFKWSYYHDNPEEFINTYQKKTYSNKRNKSGYTGVRHDKKFNKWEAKIMVNRKNIYLGRFDTYEEAVMIRKKTEEKYLLSKTNQNNKEENNE